MTNCALPMLSSAKEGGCSTDLGVIANGALDWSASIAGNALCGCGHFPDAGHRRISIVRTAFEYYMVFAAGTIRAQFRMLLQSRGGLDDIAHSRRLMAVLPLGSATSI